MRSALIIGAALASTGLAYSMGLAADDVAANTAGGVLVQVALPDTLSENAQIGKRAYEANCAACHGPNAAGQDLIAPPLVHIIYEPSHHGDESFQRAAAMGVQGHHWSFGNMPPVEGIASVDVTMIVAYVRELQRANGID
jgi:mono/diheme cytochrome c family protein